MESFHSVKAELQPLPSLPSMGHLYVVQVHFTQIIGLDFSCDLAESIGFFKNHSPQDYTINYKFWKYCWLSLLSLIFLHLSVVQIGIWRVVPVITSLKEPLLTSLIPSFILSAPSLPSSSTYPEFLVLNFEDIASLYFHHSFFEFSNWNIYISSHVNTQRLQIELTFAFSKNTCS